MTDRRPKTTSELEVSLTIFDKDEPRSLRNIIWEEMRPVLDNLKKEFPEMFTIKERVLKKRAKADSRLDMIRLRFWQEYDRAQLAGGIMFLSSIIRGICGKDYWNSIVCKDAFKIAYVCTPIPQYMTRLESSLCIALDEIDEILRKPIVEYIRDKEGKVIGKTVNVKLAAEKVKIWQSLELRVRGAVVQKLAVHQRIENKTEITTNENSLENFDLSDLTAIDRKLESVKREISRAQNRELLIPPSVQVIDIPKEERPLYVDLDVKELEVEAGGTTPP